MKKIQLITLLLAGLLAGCDKAPKEATPADRYAAARKVLEQAKTPETRFYALNEAEVLAVDVGDLAAARAFAEEQAGLLPQFKDNWNYGNAVQDINQTLGRLALREKNFAAAGEFLLNSARGGGSPQLNSFGPDFRLAKELLEAGQPAPVLEYLGLCGKFWKMDRGSLEHWTRVIKEGGTPDFQDHYTRGYEKK